MAASSVNKCSSTELALICERGNFNTTVKEGDLSSQDIERIYQSYDKLILTLPTEKASWIQDDLTLYQGCWSSPTIDLKGIMYTQQHFKSRTSDIFLTSMPKPGTTWLKSIVFAIMNRKTYDINDNNHPLLTTNPHDCVPFLELQLFNSPPIADVDSMPSPRLFATHMPYSLLPESITDGGCRILHMYREPKDVFVSMFHFMSKSRSKELPPLCFEESFNLFIKGIFPSGPFWDHVVEHHKASLTQPDNFLFLKYEEMQTDAISQVKKVAEFLGQPFTLEEETNGILQGIVRLCSFEKQRNLAVNRHERNRNGAPYEVFYRKGEVGDSKNHLTPDMTEHFDQLTRQKLGNLF